ncbi:MAG: type II toxin-antitoxin system RelE/ParE family toxin [Verrucomicrobiae bacterium]|nr:type II toxin-antitoxin system RelE/ParE family toxin [Verrucomicrobiae bacterium]
MWAPVLLRAAEDDFFRIYRKLESHQSGLGEAFSDALDTSLTLLSRHPHLERKHGDSIRRYVLHRFSLGIYYRVEKDRLMICRILDLRQSPRQTDRDLEGFS